MANLDQVFPGLRKEIHQSLQYYKRLATCPTCGDGAISQCDCQFKDSQCPRGHFWHVNKTGQLVIGPAPHGGNGGLLGGRKYLQKNQVNPANQKQSYRQ